MDKIVGLTVLGTIIGIVSFVVVIEQFAIDEIHEDEHDHHNEEREGKLIWQARKIQYGDCADFYLDDHLHGLESYYAFEMCVTNYILEGIKSGGD